MYLSQHKTRIFIKSVLILFNCFLKVKGSSEEVVEIINYINKQTKNELNIFINLNNEGNILEIVKEIDIPKLIFNNVTEKRDLQPLYKRHNTEILTIVLITENNINKTFDIMDRVLWRRHYKDILMIYQQENYTSKELDNILLNQIFPKCWSKGFISVLLWTNGHLITYHPYPDIKIVYLNNVAEFLDKSHLNNFQQRSCLIPFFNYPNQCYSYINRKGQLVRTGYYYKWIQLYFEYYNGSINHLFIDMWSGNTTEMEGVTTLSNLKFCFMPMFIRKFENFFETSNVMHLSKVTLMVPNSQEINKSFYLMLPYQGYLWFAITISGLLIFVLIYLLKRNANMKIDVSKLALQSFGIILFISNGLKHRTFKYFLGQLLFLFTGLFLTNYFTTSLSSLFTSKVYEPPLKYFSDLKRTDLTILEYTADVDFLLSIDIPQVVKQRIHSGNNTEYRHNRHSLNMTYMYNVHEEYMDYILFQQYYLKHPIARPLEQVLFYRPIHVTTRYRSPLIDHFNTYSLRIRENGLMEKFLFDTKWDGVISGNIKLLVDSEEEHPLTLEHLRYAFVIWSFGLLCALVVFLMEYGFKYYKFKQMKRNIKN